MISKIKKVIREKLSARVEKMGFRHKFLYDDFDLLQTGLLDSMSFIQFIAELEEHFDTELDFENIDPSKFTTLHGLAIIINNSIFK